VAHQLVAACQRAFARDVHAERLGVEAAKLDELRFLLKRELRGELQRAELTGVERRRQRDARLLEQRRDLGCVHGDVALERGVRQQGAARDLP
jgi:hypothetical protein